jgi:hypothetical protein
LQQSGGQINFNIAKVAFAGTNPLQIEPLEGIAKWFDGVVQPDIKATALASKFALKGKLTTKKINTDIQWKELDITKLPLPVNKSWSPFSGVVSGNLNIDGPLPQLENRCRKSYKAN